MTRPPKMGPPFVWVSILVASNLLSVAAFQADLVGQAIQAASSFTSSSPALDELIFAAVNLLDSQQKPLLIFPVVEEKSAPSYLYDDDEIRNEKSFSAMQQLSNTIVLSDEEAELFQLVRQVRDLHCPGTTLRIGGGWVRDKLLNRQTCSPDIDFVLDNKSGSEFARLMHDNMSAEESDGTTLLKDYGETKSKHLQTASLRVGHLWVDFCQLRFEKYNPNSRVPTKTGIASVVEDAFRRDLTINALYYNLNTNQVEDWTEQGLKDLRNRNVRTPTSPLYTLLEDPLRILRAIRFAAQLSFSMDPGLKKAAVDKRVRRSLQQKVSKERMGKEIDAIFQSGDPRCGMELLIETKLVDTIFPLNGKEMKEAPCFVYKDGYHLLFRAQTLASRIFAKENGWDSTRRRYLWYAAFFKPFCHMISSCGRHQHGAKHYRDKKSILQRLLVQGLKRPTYDIQFVEGVIQGAHTLQRFLRKYDNSAAVQAQFLESLEPQLSTQGRTTAEFRWLCYRILKRSGPLWKESLILALASSTQYTPSEAVRLYDELVTGLVNNVGLDGAILELKPLLNGSQIQSRALPRVQGKQFKQIMAAQEKWQVHHCVGGSNGHSNEEQEAALIGYLVKTFPEYT